MKRKPSFITPEQQREREAMLMLGRIIEIDKEMLLLIDKLSDLDVPKLQINYKLRIHRGPRNDDSIGDWDNRARRVISR